MPEDTIITQTGQSENLGGNAGQQPTNGFQQDGGNGQSADWDEREKALLARAYQQAQSLVDKSASRQSTQFQSVIDQFKRDYGVTLTPEQAQEMAQNQQSKSMPNAQGPAQVQAQQAPAADPSYQGFLYYHGVQDSPVFKQAYDIQNMLGVKLDQNDEEYLNLFKREQKYQPNEFVDAWKNACVQKMMRLQSTQQAPENTNLGQMPLVGSQGKKSNPYDPTRSAKSYFQEYLKGYKKQ